MTTTPINTNLSNIHSSDGIVELYCLNCSAIGGAVYYFANGCYPNGDQYSWGGQVYFPTSVGIDNKEVKSDGTELPQISFTVSNVGGGFLLAAVVSLGDLVGSTLTQWVTKASYLDAGSEPDTTQFVGPNIWKIVGKSSHTNQSITFIGACVLDLPGYMFPIRQFLVDPGIIPGPGNLFFPGVSPYHVNSYQNT